MAGYVVAVTGGVAAGKSAVCTLFASRGIVIADADVAAREIVEPGEPALAQIRARFGEKMLLPDGRLDRAQLRETIFSDADAKRELETITHPRIRERLLETCRRAPGPYAMAAIPLLAEVGGRAAYPWLQRILLVDTPPAVQLARLIARDGIDLQLAQKMIASQASRQDRLGLADDVIVNDGEPSDLHSPVERLDALYRRWSASDR